MSTNFEIESKSMISKKDYLSLMEKFSAIPTYEQTNFYISSSELDSKLEKYGMRIREKNKNYELTLKVTNSEGKLEINQEISRKSYENLKYFHIFPEGEVRNYLTENLICDVRKLKIIGKMKTTRKDIEYLGSLISIDKSKYNHIIDYEVECESVNMNVANSILQSFLTQNSIVFKKSELSKLARFLQTK